MKNKFFLILILILVSSCSKVLFKESWTQKMAPELFKVRFYTSKGNIDVEIQRSNSPKAVDRFYQLVRHHLLDRALFYRVVPHFVAQFGSPDSAAIKKWSKFPIPDEKVILGNQRGVLSYARAGKDSRSSELFFNLKDNPSLDSVLYAGVKGFPGFGKIIGGISVLDSIYSGYSEKSAQTMDLSYNHRIQYLKSFPKLDSIQRVELLRIH